MEDKKLPPPSMSALTTTASERSQEEVEKSSLPSRSRRRLQLSLSAAAKRSRLVSPPRTEADASAHPFRQQHPGWPALRELPEACWTHCVFRAPTNFAKVVEQDDRPPALLAAKIYPRRHVSSFLARVTNYWPGENSQIFHGALKSALREHLRSEFAHAGSFEYRKIAGYEDLLLRMADIYWLLFGLWPLPLQRRHLYALPTWLTLMVPCYYEWRNASGRWSPKTRMPQAPSARRFFSQYPGTAQQRWTLGRDADCAALLDVSALTEDHLALPVFRRLLLLRRTLGLISAPLRPQPPQNLCPEVVDYLRLIGFNSPVGLVNSQIHGDSVEAQTLPSPDENDAGYTTSPNTSDPSLASSISTCVPASQSTPSEESSRTPATSPQPNRYVTNKSRALNTLTESWGSNTLQMSHDSAWPIGSVPSCPSQAHPWDKRTEHQQILRILLDEAPSSSPSFSIFSPSSPIVVLRRHAAA